ncbi:hypothetical protein V6Z11_D03G163300 [Gossypium hirsutum]
MPEERQRQIRVERERRGPLNPRQQDDEGSPSTRPRHSLGSSSAAMQSPGLTRAPTQSPDAAVQPIIPTQPPFQMMPGAFSSPYMYPFPSPMAGWSQMPGSAPFPIILSGPPMYRPAAHEGSQEGLSGSSHFYQSPPTYEFQTPSPVVMQTPPPVVMQTPPHTLFFEGGSSSQVRQPDAVPEEPESPSKAREKRNPTRNRRRQLCGTESPRHRH